MEKIMTFVKENKKGIIWFVAILAIAWLTIVCIDNWDIMQEGFYEGLNR